MVHVDLFSDAAIEDPYPLYARLRRDAPVYWDEAHRVWIVTTYEDVAALLRSPSTMSSALASSTPAPIRAIRGRNLVQSDPPEHSSLRNLISKAFTPQRVSQLEARVQQLADELLPVGGPFDLVREFSYPLPVIVIAEILGVPAKDREDFKRWSDETIQRWSDEMIAEYGSSAAPPPRSPGDKLKSPMLEYFQWIITERRGSPREDLISSLIASADAEAGKLTTLEIISFCTLLLVAGNETTTHLISNSVAAIVAHPEEQERVGENPALLPSLIEEANRFDSPVQFASTRVTTQEIEVHGQTIPAGARVLLSLGSANRDERRFAHPDRFWIERPDNDHVAFGLGPHYCIGATLARMETRIALSALLRRFPRLAASPEFPAVRGGQAILRGFKSLPLVPGS